MKKMLTNNIGLKLISVLFAIVFWLVVVNIDNPVKIVTIKDIPVTVLDADLITNNNQVYSIVSGNTVSVQVKGPRSQVEKLDKDDFIAQAPISEMSTVNAVPIYVKLRNSKYDNLIVVQKTMNMKLEIEDVISKTYDIKIHHTSGESSGYTIGKETLSPSSVTLQAPESIVNKIDCAEVDIDLSGRTEDFSEELEIKYLTQSGAQVDIGENSKASSLTTTLTSKIFAIKEVPIKVGTTGTVAKGYQLTDVTCDKEYVRIAGNNIENVESIDLPNELLNVNGKMDTVEAKVNISDYLPNDVILYKKDDNTTVNIMAKIEKLIDKEYSIPISEIDIKNLPSGYKAEFVSNNIKANIVGLQKYHDKFSVDSLKPYVDLRNAVEGENEVLVKVTLDDNMTLNDDILASIMLTKQSSDGGNETTTNETTRAENTTVNEATSSHNSGADSN